jgi:hypothetical protein
MDYRHSGKRARKLGHDRKPITSQLEIYNDDELEFLKAIDAAKKDGRTDLTWPEVLAIVKSLGYKRFPELADPS